MWKQREVNSNSKSGNHLPRVHHQLELHDATFTTRKSAKRTRTLCQQILTAEGVFLRTLAQLLGVLESHRPAVWRAPLHFRQLEAHATNPGFAKKEIQVRVQNASNKHLQETNKMVVNELTSSKRKSDSARFNNLLRRIQNELGCGFQRCENEQEMVSPRENVAQKCVRTQGGSISN